MPKCPHCGKEIDYLSISGSQDASGTASIENVLGTPDLQHSWDETSGERDVKYACPECGNLICEDFGIAEKFLKGEASPEELASLPDVLNTPENREKLANIVVRDADLDDTIGMAVAGCVRLYEEDDEKFREDWKANQPAPAL